MRLWGKFLLDKDFKLSVFALLVQNYGINVSLALKCCALLGISPQLKFKNLSAGKKSKLNDILFLLIRSFDIVLYKDLERMKSMYLVRYLKIVNYKSIRFTQNLPMRGQRTHSNAGTPKRVYSKLINARLRSFFFERTDDSKKDV